MKSFIEEQFPVSKVSKESYKERMAGSGQTLTGLGKWWGRKPLILVRAALLGLLMPASSDKKRDMEIFLKILTMDKDGLEKRRYKPLETSEIYKHLKPKERLLYFEDSDKPILKKKLSPQEKKTAMDTAWNRFGYAQKLRYCKRPEQYTDNSSWKEINQHLATHASNLPELIEQLGKKRFGSRPKVGDCFCGGGSVPFEAARMGCDVFASDLNPIAGLLTWASLNILGASDPEIAKLEEFRKTVYDQVDSQILKWGIETNEQGDRADSYIYCTETKCPECHFTVPLAPSWIIGKGTKTIAILKKSDKKFEIEIKSNASPSEIRYTESMATVKKNAMHCPNCNAVIPISSIRKNKTNPDGSTSNNLRKWEKSDFIPRKDDIFTERLYCIRYERQFKDKNGRIKKERYYTAPTPQDIKREQRVIKLLSERFSDWQKEGYIPSTEIESGDKTDEPIRTRGWTHWHHLFNPRQLLVNGLISETVNKKAETHTEVVLSIIIINKIVNWGSKLSRWDNVTSSPSQSFYNQALNTLFNFAARGMNEFKKMINIEFKIKNYQNKNQVQMTDAKDLKNNMHIWTTDPPYANAVNYHELSEFFIAWDRVLLKKAFPDWDADSKRILAVRGKDETFKKSMIEIYRNLSDNMPDDGMQIIMFAHQDVNVWADLALIIWSCGLQVTAAWNIVTETESRGLKSGNYAKGTVLLVLRKQLSSDTAFIDDIYPDIECEVKRQMESMRDLDDLEEPNFSDADYILSAYAASLKVLTSYRKIIEYELSCRLESQHLHKDIIPSRKKE